MKQGRALGKLNTASRTLLCMDEVRGGYPKHETSDLKRRFDSQASHQEKNIAEKC